MVAATAPAFARCLDRHGRARMSRRGSVGEQAVATAKYPGGFFLALPGLGPLCHQIIFVCCSILSGSRQAPGWPHLLRRSPSAGCAMAPHLTPDELDMITVFTAKKMGAQDICDALSKRRAAAKVPAPKVWVIHRAMAGATHKRGKVETRGTKLKLTDVQAQRLFDKRSELVVSADGAWYVPVDEIVTRARAPHVHRATAARYLRSFGVAWRRMREKPPWTGVGGVWWLWLWWW